jgi:hypothetical protein
MKTGHLFLLFCIFAVGPSGALPETSVPQAQISNGVVRATVYLPNSERGYYRGSRFDWSGVVKSLEFKGHNYFGVWFPRYNPRLNDSITGPVEEFRSGNSTLGSALGYEDAQPGATFVKIGVGVLRKPDASAYSFAKEYEIVNPGVWTSRPQSDRVEFVQELRDDLGYSYRYEKTLRLVPKRPELVLEHRLKNTGKRTIETDVYDHDFYVIDGQPTGPGVTVTFPFTPRPATATSWPGAAELAGKAEVRGKELVYTRELKEHESAASLLTGFSSSVKDNDIRVENAKAGAGVREIGNRPLVRLNFWSIRTTVCPEAYIHIKIAPGQEFKWKIRYLFYELPGNGKS